jgi:hypothetical protein
MIDQETIKSVNKKQLTKGEIRLLRALKERFSDNESMWFTDMVPFKRTNSRKAAYLLYLLCVLKCEGLIWLSQRAAYESIQIMKTRKFNEWVSKYQA